MNRARALAAIVTWLAFGGTALDAQDLSRYRVYALDSSLSDVLAASGRRASDAIIRHERPARISELEWRAPYVTSGTEMADPVRALTFLFYNDGLYQITADYEPARIEGLTVADIVASLSSAYGAPVPAAARSRVRQTTSVAQDMTLLAAWESPTTSMLLVRAPFSSAVQLVIVSKQPGAQAKVAIREAQRLDVVEEPRRELQRRQQEEIEAEAARTRTRDTNKAAFRP